MKSAAGQGQGRRKEGTSDFDEVVEPPSHRSEGTFWPPVNEWLWGPKESHMASGSVAWGSAELCAHRLREWSHHLGLLRGFGSPGPSSPGPGVSGKDLQLDQALPTAGVGGDWSQRWSLPPPQPSLLALTPEVRGQSLSVALSLHAPLAPPGAPSPWEVCQLPPSLGRGPGPALQAGSRAAPGPFLSAACHGLPLLAPSGLSFLVRDVGGM